MDRDLWWFIMNIMLGATGGRETDQQVAPKITCSLQTCIHICIHIYIYTHICRVDLHTHIYILYINISIRCNYMYTYL